MSKETKSQRLVTKAFREVRANPPDRVNWTRGVKGDEAAEEQIRAIALDKAREAGAKIAGPKIVGLKK